MKIERTFQRPAASLVSGGDDCPTKTRLEVKAILVQNHMVDGVGKEEAEARADALANTLTERGAEKLLADLRRESVKLLGSL